MPMPTMASSTGQRREADDAFGEAAETEPVQRDRHHDDRRHHEARKTTAPSVKASVTAVSTRKLRFLLRSQ